VKVKWTFFRDRPTIQPRSSRPHNSPPRRRGRVSLPRCVQLQLNKQRAALPASLLPDRTPDRDCQTGLRSCERANWTLSLTSRPTTPTWRLDYEQLLEKDAALRSHATTKRMGGKEAWFYISCSSIFIEVLISIYGSFRLRRYHNNP
jgi:hypothetical protein